MRAAKVSLVLCLASFVAGAAELKIPNRVVAGSAVAVQTSGNGEGTLYVFGPGSAAKYSVKLGNEVTVESSALRTAGRYIALLKSAEGTTSQEFYVAAGAPASIAFLAQPSRVPAARPQVVSGTAFVLDKNDNLVTTPSTVKFDLAVPGAAPVTRTATSKDGVAWVRMDSGKKDGPAQFVASLGDLSTKRVVQHVASEPCNLRIHAQPARDGIIVETDPVRDCSGNAVPDGTIVTFTQVDSNGRTTVDARIKRGIAKAQLPAANNAEISVASGVVMGNAIRWGGGK